MIEPRLPRGSNETCGHGEDLNTSNGPKFGVVRVGTTRPGALTATDISIASHATAESGACATIASCATTPRIPITSLSLRVAAAPDSASAVWLARHAPH